MSERIDRVFGGVSGCLTFGVLMLVLCIFVPIRPIWPPALIAAGVGLVLGVRYPTFFLNVFQILFFWM